MADRLTQRYDRHNDKVITDVRVGNGDGPARFRHRNEYPGTDRRGRLRVDFKGRLRSHRSWGQINDPGKTVSLDRRIEALRGADPQHGSVIIRYLQDFDCTVTRLQFQRSGINRHRFVEDNPDRPATTEGCRRDRLVERDPTQVMNGRKTRYALRLLLQERGVETTPGEEMRGLHRRMVFRGLAELAARSCARRGLTPPTPAELLDELYPF